MAAEYYELTIQNDGNASVAKFKTAVIMSYILKIVALSVIIAAMLVSGYFMILSLILYASGITIKQYTLEMTSKYEYVYNKSDLIINKYNNLNQCKQLAYIKQEDIITVGIYNNLYPPNSEYEIIATDKTKASILIFSQNGKTCCLIFSPDTYLKALLGIKSEDNNDISR